MAALAVLLGLTGCQSTTVPPETPCDKATEPIAPTNDTLHVIDHPSPNFNERSSDISLIVLHYTAAPFSTSLSTLCNPHGVNRVSAHYLVATDGTIYRLVPEAKRAWHAGVSYWSGVADVNSASIGIEIVNLGYDAFGRRPAYPQRQIDAVIRLCRDIQSRHAITDVIGHSDIAPTRKADPGEHFDWKRLAENGIGLWTDERLATSMSERQLLAALGYDTRNLYQAVQAFRRHYEPEGLITHDLTRTRARMAAVYRIKTATGR